MKTRYLMRLFIVVSVYFFTVNLHAQNTFIKAYGTTGDDYGTRFVQDAKTNDYIMVGRILSNVGHNDLYIQRTDQTGKIIWKHSYDFKNLFDVATDLKQTSDGGFIIAGQVTHADNNADFALIKLTSDGILQWSRAYDKNAYDYCSEVIITRDGGFLLAGWTSTSASDLSNYNPFTVKTDQNGLITWAWALNDANGVNAADAIYGWAEDTDGGFVGVGYTFDFTNSQTGSGPGALMLKIDKAGKIVWIQRDNEQGNSNNQGFYKVIRTSDNNFVTVRGLPGSSNGSGDRDIWLLKFDNKGKTIWSRVIGSSNYDEAFTIQETSDLDFIIAGVTNNATNGNNALLLKVSGDGTTVRWSKSIGTDGKPDNAIGVAQTAAGMALLGSTSSIGNGGSDLLMVVTDNLGKVSNCSFVKDINIVSRPTNNIIVASIDPQTQISLNTAVTSQIIVLTAPPADVQLSTADLYRIEDLSVECGAANKFCVNLVADRAVDNGIIGMEYCLNYDPSLMTPTGNGTLGQVVLSKNSNADFAINTEDPGKIHISIFYKPGAPKGIFFAGKGSVICLEFQLNPSVAAGTKYTFTSCELSEDYTTFENKVTCIRTGDLTVIPDHHLTGKVIYNNDVNRPLVYNAAAPAQYNLTKISSTDASCNVINPTVTTQTDMTGSFNYDINNGTTFNISRDIQGSYYSGGACVDVMKYINGQDALLAELISTDVDIYQSAPFRPNPFQMVSADVNTNDKIRANDVTLIMQRSVRSICEFPQDWNYTQGTSANPFPKQGVKSYDWLFVDKYTFENNPSFLIDAQYPYTSSLTTIGYWRDNVPDVPLCIPVRMQNGSCPGPIDDIYYGMLLGDINGNWAEVPNQNVRIAGNSNKIIFDVANAANLGNGYFNIPVTYSLDTAMTSLDFNFTYDQNNIQILSIDPTSVSAAAQMRSMSNNYQGNSTYFTSYTLSSVNSTSAVFNVSVYVSSGILKGDYFTSINAYLNGNTASGETTGAKTSIVTGTLAQTQYQQAFVIKPNPATDDITIDYLLSNSGNNFIRISDMLGVTVGQYDANNIEGTVMVSLGNIKPGIYNCQLIENGMVIANKKLVIAK